MVSRRAHPEDGAFNDAVHAVLAQEPPDLLVLAGFLSRIELRDYNGRAMNTHPSLIPAFCGKGFYGERVHRAVLAYGAKVTGATIHYCDEQYDTGPIILQRAIAVVDDDTPGVARRAGRRGRARALPPGDPAPRAGQAPHRGPARPHPSVASPGVSRRSRPDGIACATASPQARNSCIKSACARADRALWSDASGGRCGDGQAGIGGR